MMNNQIRKIDSYFSTHSNSKKWIIDTHDNVELKQTETTECIIQSDDEINSSNYLIYINYFVRNKIK